MSISQKPYIGTRDFFPEDMQFRNWMFDIQKEICASYGYCEYSAPILEPIDLYKAKSSEEIVSTQVYSFMDRGDREVAIRPELTPSLARMISARIQHLNLPERWFNIGNFMRYERPGRGRLREFWQLNVDILGSASIHADVEIMQLAIELLKGYKANASHFELRFNDRRLMESFLGITDAEQLRQISRLIDKKDKISESEFTLELEALSSHDSKIMSRVTEMLQLQIGDLDGLAREGRIGQNVSDDLQQISHSMQKAGYADYIRFDPGIARGFDYYTGFIFEINDLHPDNNRALFGGGRYDKLIGLFGKNDLPAVGFGMGDVTLENFIRSHDLIAEGLDQRRGVFVSLMDESLIQECTLIAREIRQSGIMACSALESAKKFGKQIQMADKKNFRYVVIYGQTEHQNKVVQIKDLATGEQAEIARQNVASWFKEKSL